MKRTIKPNKVKQKIINNEPVICAFIRIPEPSIAEIMAICGVELIVLDCEHYQFNPETLVNIIRAADIYGVSCLVRITGADPGHVCRMLDMGAAGILLADAENAEQVRKVVDAAKFFPHGHRGVSTDSRGNQFGFLVDSRDHARYSNDNTIIFVVVETQGAVEELDEILAIPEVDIVSVGAADLSHTYGYPGEPDHPKLLELRESIYQRIVASGKMALDKAPTLEDAERAYRRGIRCFYVSSDAMLLSSGLKKVIDPLKEKFKHIDR